ncbi:MAG: hypothetical protein K2K21_10055 [Lachnospiraceae bacterium]|nr:hypothetical protein [Lachnospiraceae bacterium]
MITPGIMKILHESIQIYDKLCGKSYLIAFGSKNNYKFAEVIIKQSSFWHLLGCNLEDDSNDGKNDTYMKCKNREDISEKVSSIHSFSEIKEKSTAMQNVFDFIEKANQIKIGYAIGCPEEYIFKIGTGNNLGIIGYDYPNKGKPNLLFPKSAQLKALSKISKDTYKVIMILSKDISQRDYNNIEYEIKKDVYLEIIKFLPSSIKVSLSVASK